MKTRVVCKHCSRLIGYSMTSFVWVHLGTKAAYCNYPTSNSFTAQPEDSSVGV